jgi:hypothetical protein
VPWLFFAMWHNWIPSSTLLSTISIFGSGPLFLVAFFLYGLGERTPCEASPLVHRCLACLPVSVSAHSWQASLLGWSSFPHRLQMHPTSPNHAPGCVIKVNTLKENQNDLYAILERRQFCLTTYYTAWRCGEHAPQSKAVLLRPSTPHLFRTACVCSARR